MEIDEKKLEELKECVLKDFAVLTSVWCPYFNDKVYFSGQGFKHLLYKGKFNQKKRDKVSQYMRLKLFRRACELLRLTKTVQEYFSTHHFVVIKNKKRKEKLLKCVEYWGFIAIIRERRIKVIVKRVEKGNRHFWSLIPNWKIRRKPENLEKEVINYTGDLESD